MIAKVEGEKSMIVIEKIGGCLYSMCALKKDLKVKDVRTVAKAAKDIEMPGFGEVEGDEMQIDGNEWWRDMIIQPNRFKERQEVKFNILLQGAPTEYPLPRVKLILVRGRNDLQVWFQSLHYSHVMNLNSPQTQATLPHHKTHSHKPPRP